MQSVSAKGSTHVRIRGGGVASVLTVVQLFGGQEKMEMVQAVVQLVLQLYTILGGQEKDDVVVQGHQSF